MSHFKSTSHEYLKQAPGVASLARYNINGTISFIDPPSVSIVRTALPNTNGGDLVIYSDIPSLSGDIFLYLGGTAFNNILLPHPTQITDGWHLTFANNSGASWNISLWNTTAFQVLPNGDAFTLFWGNNMWSIMG